MLKMLQRGQRDRLKRLLSVMLPIIGTQIATIGMNFFDASMSGQAGAVDLAGTAIGGNIWMPVQTGVNGVLMAGMPLVAHLLGAGEKDKINIVVRHGDWQRHPFPWLFRRERYPDSYRKYSAL